MFEPSYTTLRGTKFRNATAYVLEFDSSLQGVLHQAKLASSKPL